jgi:hypothetical protein
MELPIWVSVSVPILMLVSILIGLLLLGKK